MYVCVCVCSACVSGVYRAQRRLQTLWSWSYRLGFIMRDSEDLVCDEILSSQHLEGKGG